MIESELEKELAEWASRNKFVIHDRVWKDQLNSEKAAGYAMGELPDAFSMLRSGGDVEEAEQMAADDSEDFVRKIWTPTGMAKYNCTFSYGRKPATEENYRAFLENGGDPHEYLELHHGPRIEGWRREQITESDRVAKSAVILQFHVYSDEEWHDNIEGDESFDILIHNEELGKRKDALSQMMYNMWKLERNNNKIGTSKGNISLPIYSRLGVDSLRMPKTAESYRIILDSWANAINGTE